MEFNNNQIRRQDRLLSEARAYEILKEGEYGVLSMRTEDGEGAYGIPLSYVWDRGNSIYIHCAPVGRKLKLHRRMHKCFLLRSRTHKGHSRRIYHCIRKHRTSLYGTSQSARSRTYVCPVTIFKQILPQRQNKRAGICTKNPFTVQKSSGWT